MMDETAPVQTAPLGQQSWRSDQEAYGWVRTTKTWSAEVCTVLVTSPGYDTLDQRAFGRIVECFVGASVATTGETAERVIACQRR